MSTSATVATMITRVREAIDDMGSNPFNTDATIIGWLNDGGVELHGMFVQSFEDYIRERKTYTFDGRTPAEYPLPEDLLKPLGMDFLVSGSTSDRRRMHKFANAERNTRQDTGLTYSGTIPDYRLVGNVIEIIPNLSSGTAELFYVPEFKKLELDDSVVAKWPYVKEGWELFAIFHAIIEGKLREEDDARPYMAKKDQKKVEIIGMLTPRDAGEPWSVIDSQGIRDREEWY